MRDNVLGFPDATLGGRIRALRVMRGMNQPQLAEKLGVTKNAVTNWESGHSNPSIDNIARLCEALDVSADALFALPPREGRLTDAEWEHLRAYRGLTEYQRASVDDLMDSIMRNERRAFEDHLRRDFVRIVSIDLPASAGTGNPLEERYEGETVYVRDCPEARRADVIMTVSGDSMLPTFRDGDQIFVERTKQLQPGEIGVFSVAGEAFVKEYRPDGLHSHNPHYGVIVPGPDDQVYVFGRVLGAVTDDRRADAREARALAAMDARRGKRR
ncbi:MAG: helix-turn-helix domain-containing protein [Clostridiales bacterium]|nr:helix-turn-helix domain-containing protein [Clostridiales bacterium]